MTALTQFNLRVNLKEDATRILQTILDTGERYAEGYLSRILRGDEAFPFQKPEHQSLPSYGWMAEVYPERIKGFFRFLIQEGYLSRGEGSNGKMCLTEKGHLYLSHPQDLIARPDKFRPSPFERLLQTELREVRRHLSKQEGVPPFRIFTDHVLWNLVQFRPNSVQELGQIPGFGAYKVNRYGAAILQGLSRAYSQHQQLRHNRLIRSARNRAHQLTKTLYEAGLTEQEIAARREIQPATVRTQLMNLHRAGEIDLTSWIEHQLDAGILEKGVSFFEAHEGARMREAYETTGLDYDVLRLCRLYVSQLSQQTAELPSSPTA